MSVPEDIHDIRGPIPIPDLWVPIALAVAAVAALALAFWVGRRLWRRHEERVKSAAEVALDRIARARSTVGTVGSAHLASEVSDAVRAYIEARFSLRAAHRATEEFLRELLGVGASPIAVHRDALEAFLGWCDLAKFARLALAPDEATSLLDSARDFVLSTAPKEARRKAPAASPLPVTRGPAVEARA